MSPTVRALAMVFATGAAVAAAPRTASAAGEDANNFGDKHQLILSVDRLLPLLSYSSQTVTETGNNATVKTTDTATSAAFFIGREPTLLIINPHTIPRVAFDFTIVRHFTLGGSFAFAFGLGGKHEEESGNVTRSTDTPKNTLVGFAIRAGYIIPLGHVFAFWPRAGFAFYSLSSKTTTADRGGNDVVTTNSDTLFSFDLDPQFAWVPLEHFFIHVGPLMNIPLTGSRSSETVVGPNTTTTKNDLSAFHFGLSAGLGGWFDL